MASVVDQEVMCTALFPGNRSRRKLSIVRQWVTLCFLETYHGVTNLSIGGEGLIVSWKPITAIGSNQKAVIDYFFHEIDRGVYIR